MKAMIVAVAAMAAVLATQAAVAKAVGYRCADGSRVAAAFDNSGGGRVSLSFGKGAPVVLPLVISADGGRYADQSMEFWIKGKGATLTRNGSSTTCVTR